MSIDHRCAKHDLLCGDEKCTCDQKPSRELAPVAGSRNFMKAVELIKAERERQISEEGYSVQHDDMHNGHQIAMAAATYAWPGMRKITTHISDDCGGCSVILDRSVLWPWQALAYKPERERLRELVKAGALIVAEIERLQRRIDSMETSSVND